MPHTAAKQTPQPNNPYHLASNSLGLAGPTITFSLPHIHTVASVAWGLCGRWTKGGQEMGIMQTRSSSKGPRPEAWAVTVTVTPGGWQGCKPLDS